MGYDRLLELVNLYVMWGFCFDLELLIKHRSVIIYVCRWPYELIKNKQTCIFPF
jgi:hypothetical protein